MTTTLNHRAIKLRRAPRRAVLAVMLGGLALITGAGAASAAGSPNGVIETGYATVIEDSPAAPAGIDCPDPAGEPTTPAGESGAPASESTVPASESTVPASESTGDL